MVNIGKKFIDANNSKKKFQQFRKIMRYLLQMIKIIRNFASPIE